MGFLKRRSRRLATTAVTLLVVGVVGGALATTFVFSSLLKFPPAGGSLAPYLVAPYDLRISDCFGEACASNVTSSEARITLVNPTPLNLTAYVVAFDDDENPLNCRIADLTPNDHFEINLRDSGVVTQNRIGVIKIVTFDKKNPGIKVQAGLKGWVSHFVIQTNDAGAFVVTRESEMDEVPVEVLKHNNNVELNLIVNFVKSDGC